MSETFLPIQTEMRVLHQQVSVTTPSESVPLHLMVHCILIACSFMPHESLGCLEVA